MKRRIDKQIEDGLARLGADLMPPHEWEDRVMRKIASVDNDKARDLSDRIKRARSVRHDSSVVDPYVRALADLADLVSAALGPHGEIEFGAAVALFELNLICSPTWPPSEER